MRGQDSQKVVSLMFNLLKIDQLNACYSAYFLIAYINILKLLND